MTSHIFLFGDNIGVVHNTSIVPLLGGRNKAIIGLTKCQAVPSDGPTRYESVGLLTYEENLIDLDNSHIITFYFNPDKYN